MTDDARISSGFAQRRADGFLAGQRPWRMLPGGDGQASDQAQLALVISAHLLHRRALIGAIQALADMSGQPGVAAALHGLSKGDVETAEALLAAEAARLAGEGKNAHAATFFRHMSAFLWLTDPAAAKAPLDQALDLTREAGGTDWPILLMRALLAVALPGASRSALADLSTLHPALIEPAPDADDAACLALTWYVSDFHDRARQQLSPHLPAADAAAPSRWIDVVDAVINDPLRLARITAATVEPSDTREMAQWADVLDARSGNRPVTVSVDDVSDPMLADLLRPPGGMATLWPQLQVYLPRMMGYAVIGAVVAMAYVFVTR